MYIKKSSNITCRLAFNHEWSCNVSRIVLLVKSEFLYPILIVHCKLSSAGMKGFIFIHISRGIVFSADYLEVALWNLWQEGEGGTTYTIIVWDCLVQLSCGAMPSCVCLGLLLPMIKALPVAAVFKVPLPKSHKVWFGDHLRRVRWDVHFVIVS